MKNDFCRALAANDRQTLQKVVDDFLVEVKSENDQQQRFQRIESWISDHDCVRSVEASPDLIDTDPPIKQFIVTPHGDAKPITIGISLAQDRWRFHRK
ncbi:MAG TPA: hypothetical protein VFZ23_04340 [Pyrinomonadaceae bacterium]